MSRFKLYFVFYIEVLINISTCIICLVMPKSFIRQMLEKTPDMTEIGYIELTRWYGILLLVITLILLRTLTAKNLKALMYVLEAYLIGDIIQIAAAILLAAQIEKWTIGIIIAIGLTIPLIVARGLALWKPEWIGFRKEKD